MLSRTLFRTNLTHLTASRAIFPTAVRSLSTTPAFQTKFIDPLPKDFVPSPTEQVPDVQTFLTKIGRNCSEYADKFESWEHFMSVTTHELKEKGVDSRPRRYILAWREKFKRGEELTEIKRGKKRWGGERKRDEVRAKHFGRLKAEARESAARK
ncbi:Fyv4p [Sugiyamaella lignohabitans]|uniref:Small ribosomal subunit protein mS41 n=1 Tax=Sugiyamaella lignohabitans TaxID=796027 RepID=A0A167DWE2_9ASCO|nr:Fyv4p [Sugiyamaella lignohabitans]ANB13375.1 Fyv4p [Sugiyamaella lignohabitans]